MMSYAEDETDVDGTVNGVTNTASGGLGELVLLPRGGGVGEHNASRGLGGTAEGEPRRLSDGVSAQPAVLL